MVEELKKNKDVSETSGAFLGSLIGYQIGQGLGDKAAVPSMLIGGYIGKMTIKFLMQ